MPFEGNQLLGLIDRLRASFVGRDEIVQRGADVNRNTNLTGITNGIATPVGFNVVIKDTDSLYAAGTPSRLTARVQGWYVISGGTQLQFTAGAAIGVETLTFLRINGSGSTGISQAYSVNTTTAIYNTTNKVVYLNAADYVELMVQHNGAGSTMQVPANGGRLAMVRYP